MKIYRIEMDVDSYKSLIPSDPVVRQSRTLALNGSQKMLHWSPVEVELDNEGGLTPDVYSCGAGNILVQSRALGLLEGDISKYSELLPVFWGAEEGLLVNITDLSNCLDEDATRWYCDDLTGERLMIEEYAFARERVPHALLFKIVQAPFRTFCADHEDGSTCLPSLIRAHNLTGLALDLVW